IRVRRRGIEVVVELLRVLAVIAFAVGEPEDPFFENRIASVPKREREAQPLLVVAEASDPVLTPPIRATAGVVMREILPGVSMGAVVFAYRSPLAFGKIGSPLTPGFIPSIGLSETVSFGGIRMHKVSR